MMPMHYSVSLKILLHLSFLRGQRLRSHWPTSFRALGEPERRRGQWRGGRVLSWLRSPHFLREWQSCLDRGDLGQGTMRRRGIGKTLMENFEEWSRNRGNRLVALATRRAAAFYASIDMRSPRLFFERPFEANNISIDLTCNVASAERELPLLFAPDLPNVPSFLPRRGCNNLPSLVAFPPSGSFRSKSLAGFMVPRVRRSYTIKCRLLYGLLQSVIMRLGPQLRSRALSGTVSRFGNGETDRDSADRIVPAG